MAELAGFDEFYAASRRVVGQVSALLGDLHEAEDVTQDAFAKASFSGPGSPPTTSPRPGCGGSRSTTRTTATAGPGAGWERWPATARRPNVPAASADHLDLHRALGRLTPRHREVERNLAWPAPRKVAFIARFADSDSVPGRYRLVEADPRTGRLTTRPAVLATDPSPGRRVTPRFIDADPGGRYLLYGIDGLSLTTRWVDTGGKRPPVKAGQFDALSTSERHAYEAGDW